MSPMRFLAGLALAVAFVGVTVNARTAAYNGYKVSADISSDTWGYFDLELTLDDFLGHNETDNYMMYLETNIDDTYTTHLWFGTADVTNTGAGGEIDPDAKGGGRGDRHGEVETPGPNNYVLSVFATCDTCNTVLTEVSLYLVDGNGNLVPFKIRPKLYSVDLDDTEGEVLVWGFHNTTAVDDEIYVQMSLNNQLNSVDVVYEAGAYPTALSNRYPTGASIDGNYLTAPLAVGAGITYFGSLGVVSIAGGHHSVLLGINQVPTTLDVGPPNCVGEFTLDDDETDYSVIADCVTFDGSIYIDTSALIGFSLPNLESITGTLQIQSPLISVSLPSLETAGELIIGLAADTCNLETLSLPSLTTVNALFQVACQNLRAFDLPVATGLGECDLFWFGEDPAEIDIPCGGVMVTSVIPVDLTFTLETATDAYVPSIAFGRLSFPNLVSVSPGWAGFNQDIHFENLMDFDVEVGDLQMHFPSLNDIDGGLLAMSEVEGGEADASATIFMPELTDIIGDLPGADVITRGVVIPVAVVAPKLETITGGLSVAGEAAVYFDALETVTDNVEIYEGTVCFPALASVGGDFTVTMSSETCVLPDVNDIEDNVTGAFAAAPAPVCTVEECTAPTGLESGAARLGSGGAFGLATLTCALVATVAAVVVG